MSIYITGMEMPTSCCNCLLSKLIPPGHTLVCGYTLATVPRDNRPFDCPLVSVPPHGRLVDADVILKKLWEFRRHYQMLDDFQIAERVLHGIYLAEKIISETPTIIPASEELSKA